MGEMIPRMIQQWLAECRNAAEIGLKIEIGYDSDSGSDVFMITESGTSLYTATSLEKLGDYLRLKKRQRELLPCPLCHGSDVLYSTDSRAGMACWGVVSCNECGLALSDYAKPKGLNVIERWNADRVSTAQVITRMRKEIRCKLDRIEELKEQNRKAARAVDICNGQMSVRNWNKANEQMKKEGVAIYL